MVSLFVLLPSELNQKSCFDFFYHGFQNNARGCLPPELIRNKQWKPALGHLSSLSNLLLESFSVLFHASWCSLAIFLSFHLVVIEKSEQWLSLLLFSDVVNLTIYLWKILVDWYLLWIGHFERLIGCEVFELGLDLGWHKIDAANMLIMNDPWYAHEVSQFLSTAFTRVQRMLPIGILCDAVVLVSLKSNWTKTHSQLKVKGLLDHL